MSGSPQVSDSVDPLLSGMDHNLTIVLFGNSAAAQFQHDNILLGEIQPDIENVEASRIVPLQIKISGCHISVISLIGLHETAFDPHPLIGQLVNDNEINAFIFVVRLGQLTDSDKMGLEWLQRVFGDEVLQFVMILFTYESEEESDSIIDDLKKNSTLERLTEKCGGRYHTCSKNMNSQSEMRDLLNRIENLFIENKQQSYTSEMYNTALREREDLQNRITKNQPTITEESMEFTTTKETGERLEPKVDKHSEDGARLNQSKGSGISENIQHLLQILNNKNQSKLRAADVLQLTAHSLQYHESCAEKDLIQTFLQKLLMMNYRARYIKTNETNKQQDGQQGSTDIFEDEDDVDIFSEMPLFTEGISRKDAIHPMDVQMAVFHCADSFLKQLMVTKLSQCQYALPLLVPDPFTQEIEFPLWTFRQINKSWKMKDTKNEISQIQPVWKAETPMVSFFRFGSVSLSKSQLMNSLINEKHNTFFHRHCPGSSKTRVLMDGVVEIAWYCPSGKETDKFTQCISLCNLHGDAGNNKRQLQILTEMGSVNVVILPRLDRNDKSATQMQNLYKDKKPLICLFTEDEYSVIETRKWKYKIGLKGRNQSDVSEELIQTINKCLSFLLSESSSVFKLEDVSKQLGIRVDEERDNDCRRGKEAAQQMMGLLKDKNLTEIKESFLPCQGKLWHQWCEKNKELHRFEGNEIEIEINVIKQEMKKIRKQQHVLDIGDFMKLFITEINSQSPNEKVFFFKWLTILLDEYTSADLSALHYKYDEKWSEVLKLKEKNEITEEQIKTNFTDEQTELDRISKELQAATFGLEHILREIGQIYESCKSEDKNKEGLPCDFSSLPSLAAEMMISGFPVELMDGDAAHVPVVWVSAVLDELIKKLGDQRVFVLSVLGIQSSGKSTMLNAMFGLQFAVSAGRCTRGAFMQLVRVSDEMKTQMNFDYILVVDTEGLHAPELAGRSTRHHDNELATFVVGLANLTVINILGENLAEMQDIFQFVVQAFMRMKKVKLNPSCVFVHQNISDVTAGEKNMEGRRRLQETLDEMTKLAAEEEGCDAERFSDVIKFDVQNDVKYFAQLWEGNPPMAPPNPNYCENIQELKKTIVSHASKSHRMSLTNLKYHIKDLWEALLKEQFVFNFENSLETAAKKKLQNEYSKWSQSLQNAWKVIENKLHNEIKNEAIHEVEETYLQRELNKISKKVEKSILDFFEKDAYAEILIQWKPLYETKIKDLQENIVRETKGKLKKILQHQDLKKKTEERKQLENTLIEKSKELALNLKDKANDEETLRKEFDLIWENSVKKIITDSDILNDVIQVLSDYKQGKMYNNILVVTNYSEYVNLIKSSEGRTRQGVKESTLTPEDNAKIRSFVKDVVQKTDTLIQSFNISEKGYNISYIQQLTDYIKKCIIEHQKKMEKYEFLVEFFVNLVYFICKKAKEFFIDQHRLFREASDPDLYTKKKREEFYSIFQKHCHGATSAAILGEIICQKLKEPIEQSVYKNTARDLTDEIISNCESLNGNRSNLEKHILKRLAEEEDFDKYMNYIHNPRDHFKSFIRDEVSQYITDLFSVSVLPKMEKNIKCLQQKIMKAAHESTENVQLNRGDVSLWLKRFTQQLSVEPISHLKHDDVDFKFLEDVIKQEFSALISEITSRFDRNTFSVKMQYKFRLDELLIDHFCQCCWVQCPFCGATCTNTIENHDGDHSVPLHRVTGINGLYFTNSMSLCTNICTDLYKSDLTFISDDGSFSLRDYRRAGGVYADWSITPDLSELPYWKWFVCRFQEDLEKKYKKTFDGHGTIPDNWRTYSKHEAVETLVKYI